MRIERPPGDNGKRNTVRLVKSVNLRAGRPTRRGPDVRSFGPCCRAGRPDGHDEEHEILKRLRAGERIDH